MPQRPRASEFFTTNFLNFSTFRCPVFTPVIQGDLQYDRSLNLAYAEIWAYKFPDQSALYFQCQIQICNKRDNECVGVTVSSRCPNIPLLCLSLPFCFGFVFLTRWRIVCSFCIRNTIYKPVKMCQYCISSNKRAVSNKCAVPNKRAGWDGFHKINAERVYWRKYGISRCAILYFYTWCILYVLHSTLSRIMVVHTVVRRVPFQVFKKHSKNIQRPALTVWRIVSRLDFFVENLLKLITHGLLLQLKQPKGY